MFPVGILIQTFLFLILTGSTVHNVCAVHIVAFSIYLNLKFVWRTTVLQQRIWMMTFEVVFNNVAIPNGEGGATAE